MDDRSDVQSVRSGATASTRAARREKFRPGLVLCDLSAPSKSVGFFDQHVLFKVGCSTALKDYVTMCRTELVSGHATFAVTRRYNDFVWVRTRLRSLYPG